MMTEYTPEEMMIVEVSRRIPDGSVCFVGVGRPTLAAGLARSTRAPNVTLVFESGAIGAKPTRPPHSIADSELAETADFVVSTPEMFAYWLGGGHIDIGILGAAQIDRHGNINSTVVGPYDRPTVRLPGAGGAPEIAGASTATFVMAPHQARIFVPKLDFRTTIGRGDRAQDRADLGLPGVGVQLVVTDLCVMEFDPTSAELVLTRLHQGIEVDEVRRANGWDLKIAADVDRTAPPTEYEISSLRTFITTAPPSSNKTALDLPA